MENFLALFSIEEQTTALQKLAYQYFENDMWMADEMELSGDYNDALQHFILDEVRLAKSKEKFVIFGQATHSGSLYAFYKAPTTKNADEWPILVLGDEGGAVMIAENLSALMRFWTLNNVGPYIDSVEEKTFSLWRDEELEESNVEYKKWIQKEFGLSSISNLEEAQNEIIKPAIEKYQAQIDPVFKIE